MKTFETEKHNIPEGATHYRNEDKKSLFTWFKVGDSVEIWCDIFNCWKLLSAYVNTVMDQITPIPQTKEVEWENGLPPVGEKVVLRYMFDSKTVCHCGYVLYASESHCILDINGKECHYKIGDYQYEKPETEEQRKEREELEATYQLQSKCAIAGSVSFESFKEHDCAVNFWKAIVKETGYRVEK